MAKKTLKNEDGSYIHDATFPANINPTEENRKAYTEAREKGEAWPEAEKAEKPATVGQTKTVSK